MNPIIAAIREELPGVDIPSHVMSLARRASDKDGIAQTIAFQVSDIRRDFRETVGGDMPLAAIADQIVMHPQADKRANRGAKVLLRAFGREEILEHARASLGPVDAMYWGILGRAPDPQRKFWDDLYAELGDEALPMLVQAMVDDKKGGAR